MKYEITKGSEKDFEGAPEWARFRTSSYFFEGFSEGLRWGYIPSGCNFVSNHGVWRNAESPFQHHINKVIAERRPITEPVWDGEGLPPVGVECEGLFPRHPGNSFEWQDCLVLYVFEHECAVKSKGTSTLHYCDQFRPIRSPEDVARDDFIKKLSGNVIEGFSIGTKFAAALYDAGYRKME